VTDPGECLYRVPIAGKCRSAVLWRRLLTHVSELSGPSAPLHVEAQLS
jgi:hypothetical protein